jgi:hypothetical protein
MAFRVIYATEIYDDLQLAVDFYNSRKKGLGGRFFLSVKVQITQISSNAFSFQVRYSDIRCAPIKSFPYTIHYRVDSEKNTIEITAILCDYRDPKIGVNRLL